MIATIVINKEIMPEFGTLTKGTLVAFDICHSQCYGRFGKIESVNLSDSTVTIDDYPYGFHRTVRHSSDCRIGKMIILGREEMKSESVKGLGVALREAISKGQTVEIPDCSGEQHESD